MNKQNFKNAEKPAKGFYEPEQLLPLVTMVM